MPDANQPWPDNMPPHRVRNAVSPLFSLLEVFTVRLATYRDRLAAMLEPGDAELLSLATSFDAGQVPPGHRREGSPNRASVIRDPGETLWTITDGRLCLGHDDRFSSMRGGARQFATPANALTFYAQWTARQMGDEEVARA